MNSRKTLLLLVATLLAIIVSWWGWSELQSAKLSHSQAVEDTRDAAAIVESLLDSGQRADYASTDGFAPAAIGEHITLSLATAKIPTSALITVSPMPLIRLGRTDYLQRSTEVSLEGLSMEQIARFAIKLGEASDGAVVDTIALDSTVGDRWNVRVILTQTFFFPTSDGFISSR